MHLVRASGPAATLATVEAAGYTTGGPTTPDEAIADDAVALIIRDDGVVEAVGRFFDDETLARALSAGGGQATTALWQGVTDSYELTRWHDGAFTRRLSRSERELVEDVGEPLAAEAGLDWEADPERALFDLVTAVVGEPVGVDDWMARPAVVLEEAPPEPASERRRFGRRR